METISKILTKIEKSLGHYVPIGGPAPPYIKTDDKTIQECLGLLRRELQKQHLIERTDKC